MVVRAAALGTLSALFASGCGGIRVASVTNPRPIALQERWVEPPSRFLLGVAEDAVIHSYAPWAKEPLGTEDWLRAGSDLGRGVHWVSYLRFELGAIPAGTPVASARLRLPLEPTGLAEGFKFAVHGVTSDWNEASVTWARQPSVTPGPVARGVGRGGEEGVVFEEVDVTRVVGAALAADARFIDFAILPVVGTGARTWHSRESVAEPTSRSVTVVSLDIRAGEPPAPPSAAEQDLLLGGRENLGE